MALDRLIDPVTGDVQSAPAGGFVLDEDLANKVVLSYLIPLGSWEGDPTFGHRFNELARAIDTIETRKRVGDFALQAVQWLLASGELAEVDVEVRSYGPGVVAFQALCFKPGEKNPLAGVGLQFVPVGGA